MEMIQINNLCFTYPNVPRPALEAVSLRVHAGEFVVLTGTSGSGKTTLLRQLKPSLTPHGMRGGEVRIAGAEANELDRRTEAETVGYVMQDPEMQIVTDTVFRELAFGMESLGFTPAQMRLRAAELASYFGIVDWFELPTAQLSGGQKQILNLASVMAMQPGVLVLDEPTAQLDPIGARAFIDMLVRVNRELGTTVLLAEHRLDLLLRAATRLVYMENGKVAAEGTPQTVLQQLYQASPAQAAFMPHAAKVFFALHGSGDCPMTTAEGKHWLKAQVKADTLCKTRVSVAEPVSQPDVVSMRDVWFRYEKQGKDILKGVTLDIRGGEIFALLGDNGSGKSTLLRLLAGQNRPLRGKLRCTAKTVCLVPQNPQLLFSKESVRAELQEVCVAESRIADMAEKLDITALLERHPYDLSGGEMQRAALAKALLLSPQLLVLDEPFKGLDAANRSKLACLFKTLDTTIVLVSHDMDTCARCASRCALLFNGRIAAVQEPHAFFAQNRFYTTAARRMSEDILDNAITDGEVIDLCKSKRESTGRS